MAEVKKPGDITLEEIVKSDSVDNNDKRTPEEIEAQRVKDEVAAEAKKLADAAEAKAKELGGVKFNDAGDLLDAEGKVVKTKAELEAAPADDDESEEVTLTEDKDGNITDAEGKILIKKEDVKRNEKGEVIIPDDLELPKGKKPDAVAASIIDETQKRLGVIVNDDKGQPKKYEDTEAGLIEYVNDAAPVLAQAIIKKTFEGLPDVQRYFYHRANGGQPQDFFVKPTNWNKVAIDDKTPKEQVLSVIEANFRAKGIKDEQAKNLTKMIGDGAEFLKEGQAALTELQEGEKARDKAQKDRYEAARLADEKAINEYWDGIKVSVNKGEIDAGTVGKVMIPESERAKFFEYISKPVDENGRSQEMIDIEEDKEKLNLVLSYLRYKKIDVEALIKSKAGSERANTLTNKLRSSGNTKSVKVVKVIPAQNITLENLIS